MKKVIIIGLSALAVVGAGIGAVALHKKSKKKYISTPIR